MITELKKKTCKGFIAAFATLSIFVSMPALSSIILFEDDFSSNDLSNWSLSGGSQTWQVINGELVTNRVPSGFRYFGINGITTPDKFVFSVDVRNIAGASNKVSSQGHGGIFWDQTSLGIDNKTYIRTHSDHLNLVSIGAGETHAPIVADNGDTIRYTLDVDYLARELLINATLIAGANQGNATQISYVGNDFDTYVRSFGAGELGLLTWGDAVAFDNVKITTVSEPWSIAMLGFGILGLSLYRRKQQ